jgi:hypothetical protein
MTDEPELPPQIMTWKDFDPAKIPPRERPWSLPIEMDNTPVKSRAEPLHPVWWRGRQWAVTEYGIEALDGRYVIEASRLTEDIEIYGGWPAHIGKKIWVDVPDFVTAWLVALSLHGADTKHVNAAVMSDLWRQCG